MWILWILAVVLIVAFREAYGLEPIKPPTRLQLCKKELTFSEFDDERGCI